MSEITLDEKRKECAYRLHLIAEGLFQEPYNAELIWKLFACALLGADESIIHKTTGEVLDDIAFMIYDELSSSKPVDINSFQNVYFGQALSIILKKKGISPSKLAKLSGLDRPYISKLVNGKFKEPSWSKAIAIINALNLTESEILQLTKAKSQ